MTTNVFAIERIYQLKCYLPAIVLLVALLTIQCATAQGCPPGQYPVVGQGWNYCAAAPNSAAQSQQAEPSPVWDSRYQSVAADIPKGILGTSRDQTTAIVAEQVALTDCKAKGGVSCEIQITNSNGCVAMAVGNTRLNLKSGDSKDEAEGKALRSCNEEDQNCQVRYSACSLPKRVR